MTDLPLDSLSSCMYYQLSKFSQTAAYRGLKSTLNNTMPRLTIMLMTTQILLVQAEKERKFIDFLQKSPYC